MTKYDHGLVLVQGQTRPNGRVFCEPIHPDFSTVGQHNVDQMTVPSSHNRFAGMTTEVRVNRSVCFTFDYLHGDVAKRIGATNFGDAGSKFNAFTKRTQVAF